MFHVVATQRTLLRGKALRMGYLDVCSEVRAWECSKGKDFGLVNASCQRRVVHLKCRKRFKVNTSFGICEMLEQ